MISFSPAVSRLIETIASEDPSVRDTSLQDLVREMKPEMLQEAIQALDQYRRKETNLYRRVRALFFLHAICRFALPPLLEKNNSRPIPAEVQNHLLDRRFAEAVDVLLETAAKVPLDDALVSAMAQAFYQLGLQFLVDQVRRSVRSVRGNQWMFRCGHPEGYPLRIHPGLLNQSKHEPHPILHEQTAVRMDLSHSGWSDIFFLGMDFPEGARVLNISVDLSVEGRDSGPRPPVAACFRVIDEPLIRLTSVDLEATTDLTSLPEVFDFARDHLGLLKAAVIASGLVPIGMEASGTRLEEVLRILVGPGRGFELVSTVNNIPKGSRLAVSTNLLGALIAACMRATRQIGSLEGPLEEGERRTVAARAILGEWLGGSGGGWQDSGGVWPGIKIIEGSPSGPGDPEYGISRGRLLPTHTILGTEEISEETRRKLQDSLVLVHGGMAQNVGPILEMVTEKYLLRSEPEWTARRESLAMFDEILTALRRGDIRRLGDLTTRHFFGPLQKIIPWASNLFTERAIARAREEFGEDFWGFWMLGGMSGGGMGFIFAPERASEAKIRMREILQGTKRELEHSLPFAMDPVVYEFAINETGSRAEVLTGQNALMPPAYYPLVIPTLLRADPRSLPEARRIEMGTYGSRAEADAELRQTIEPLIRNLIPRNQSPEEREAGSLDDCLKRHGFDQEGHERIRADLRAGRTGLAQNRLPSTTTIEDVDGREILDGMSEVSVELRRVGEEALANGELAVVSLAGGVGSRWTEGAGVVKALHPFCRLAGRHRSFVETHLAKSQKIGEKYGGFPPHIFTTSYLTHDPIQDFLSQHANFGYEGPVLLSLGRSIGLRLVPMVRDLRFAYEETRHQVLDERKQKMRESGQQALMEWALATGEATDYRDNVPSQCLHPVGHWYEIPNLLLNGTLAKLLQEKPALRTLLLHNIDTVGAHPDPALFGLHRKSGSALTFEVISRRIEDQGGGLAKVNGKIRLIEGLSLPNEEDEFLLTHYNTLTTWIDIDLLLKFFGLDRSLLGDPVLVARAVRQASLRLPTYITLKDVKKRWGHGQEDVFPVAQFEKLWGDMSALPDLDCSFALVARARGQQLKMQAQLDGWVNDGSAARVEALGSWRD